MDPVVWAILLLAISLVLVALDMFIPSGGVITALALLAAVASIGMAIYYKGAAVGAIFIFAALVLLPAAFGLMIKVWPRTPMGRRLLLDVHTGDEVLPDDDPRRHLQQLVGHVGRAVTVMLPGGEVEIDGRMHEAVSEGMSIEAGDAVRVTGVRHSRLVVQKV